MGSWHNELQKLFERADEGGDMEDTARAGERRLFIGGRLVGIRASGIHRQIAQHLAAYPEHTASMIDAEMHPELHDWSATMVRKGNDPHSAARCNDEYVRQCREAMKRLAQRAAPEKRASEEVAPLPWASAQVLQEAIPPPGERADEGSDRPGAKYFSLAELKREVGGTDSALQAWAHRVCSEHHKCRTSGKRGRRLWVHADAIPHLQEYARYHQWERGATAKQPAKAQQVTSQASANRPRELLEALVDGKQKEGLHRNEIAKQAGVSARTLHRITKGDRAVSEKTRKMMTTNLLRATKSIPEKPKRRGFGARVRAAWAALCGKGT